MRSFLGLLLFISCTWLILSTCADLGEVTAHGIQIPDTPFEKLSEYGFFESENLPALQPVSGVLPYELITPLFSDYAEKLRFVWMPEGKAAKWTDQEVFDFPVGAVLIKTFYYNSNAGRKLIETRLLIHEKDGWNALPYIWDEQQQEASLKVAGGSLKIDLAQYSGNPHTGKETFEFEYIIPNKNQCKGCHSLNGSLSPIGPKARNLNSEYPYQQHLANQLEKWIEMGYLADAPAPSLRGKLSNWEDKSVPLDLRAAAYLEMNCGHCHRREGPAATSGLHLMASGADLSDFGLCKTPVAAGKGSGGFKFDIDPGHPESSILVHRMASEDPGVRMPEVGRQLVHAQGLALISSWIEAMEGDCELSATP